jgi:hypothetical protein
MGVQLSIDSEEIVQMESRLAERADESVPEAAGAASRERLSRQTEACDASRLKAKLQALAGEIKAHMIEPASPDHGWLYNDKPGRPR